MMNKNKRQLLKLHGVVITGAIVSPTQWLKPVLSSVVLPAHAMTSLQCSAGVTNDSLNSAIEFEVQASQVRGPYTSVRNGLIYTANLDSITGSCNNGAPMREVVTINGIIDTVADEVSGDLRIEVYCGSVLACLQETTFVAVQTSVTGGVDSENGFYQGTLTGTIECCNEFGLLKVVG